MQRNTDIERIAETHFLLRPKLKTALRDLRIDPDPRVRQLTGDYETYLDMWEAGYGDRFFDMTTMIRLGTALESGLRDLHRIYGGDVSDRGLYQRIVRPTQIVRRFKDDCDYDLSSNTAWDTMREVMLHRHLYGTVTVP